MEAAKPSKVHIHIEDWVKVDNFIRGEVRGKIHQTGNLTVFDDKNKYAEDARFIYSLGEERRKLT